MQRSILRGQRILHRSVNRGADEWVPSGSKWKQNPKLGSGQVVCLLIWFVKLFLWLPNKRAQTKAAR